jgi:hypothetical protein
LIYGDTGCSSCAALYLNSGNIVDSFTAKTSYVFNIIDKSEINTTERIDYVRERLGITSTTLSANIFVVQSSPVPVSKDDTPVPTPPSFVKAWTGATAEKTDKLIKTEKQLSAFIYKHTVPSIPMLTLAKVREKIASGEEFNLYIGRPTCPSCKGFRVDFLNNFLVKNYKKLNFYSFDTDEVRLAHNPDGSLYVTERGSNVVFPYGEKPYSGPAEFAAQAQTYLEVRIELQFRQTPTFHHIKDKKFVSSFISSDFEAGKGPNADGKWVADYSTYNIWDLEHPTSFAVYDKSLEGKVFDSQEAYDAAFEELYHHLTIEWFTKHVVKKA